MAGMLAQGWNRMRHSAVFFGALGTLVRIGANLLLLPLLLEKLTTAELALWWVFVALGALANLADFGFGQAVSRVYSYLWAGADDFETEALPPLTTADPNFERIHQFTESVRQLYTGLGLIAVLLLVSIGTFLSLHQRNRAEITWCSGRFGRLTLERWRLTSAVPIGARFARESTG